MNEGDMPAMPTSIAASPSGDIHEGFYGLTKREAFAMAAMQSLLPAISDEYVNFSDVAEEAVEMANKLLKALEKDNG